MLSSFKMISGVNQGFEISDKKLYHIPGYCGYIPHVYAGNMFGKTYGVITNIAGQKSRDTEKHTNEYYEAQFSRGFGEER